jgi:hypothetical protein
MVFHAQRSYYEALLRAGVRIYCYPAPAILHSKFFSIDNDVASTSPLCACSTSWPAISDAPGTC